MLLAKCHYNRPQCLHHGKPGTINAVAPLMCMNLICNIAKCHKGHTSRLVNGLGWFCKCCELLLHGKIPKTGKSKSCLVLGDYLTSRKCLVCENKLVEFGTFSVKIKSLEKNVKTIKSAIFIILVWSAIFANGKDMGRSLPMLNR